MVTFQLDDKVGERIQARARKRGMSTEKYVIFLSQNEELWSDIEEALSEESISLSSADGLLRFT